MMAWSTSQLADLAGTTVKAVRHYHSIGLLAEPERAANGYKQYEAAHLVRLLQIRRMSELGLSLADIAAAEPGTSPSGDAIRLIDAELGATIERLQRIRAELAVVLEHDGAFDVPAGFGAVAQNLSTNDRTMMHVFSRVLDERAMADLRELMSERDPVDDEFEALPADADEATVQDLAERMAGPLAAAQERHPVVMDPTDFAVGGVQQAATTVARTMVGLYNPAQLEVLRRSAELAAALREPGPSR